MSSEELCILASWFSSLIRKNSVLEELPVIRYDTVDLRALKS